MGRLGLPELIIIMMFTGVPLLVMGGIAFLIYRVGYNSGYRKAMETQIAHSSK